MTYKMIKKIIESGAYEKEDILNKLSVFLEHEKITQQQYDELFKLVNN